MYFFLVLLTLDLKTQTILFIDGCLLGIARVFLDLPRILRKWTLANSYTKIYIYIISIHESRFGLVEILLIAPFLAGNADVRLCDFEKS